MAPPRRRAALRTPAAVAEDLVQARRVGGLQRARELDLIATLDLIALSGLSPDEPALPRARDLLTSYVRRGCAQHKHAYRHDLTAEAAVVSLKTLLLRPASDTSLADVVRRQAIQRVTHSVTTDAVRHREDRIISEIAAAVFADLIDHRGNEPQTIEAALHVVMPMVADVRDLLETGMKLTYPKRMPPDPREARAQNNFYGQVMVKSGWLVEASRQLALLGRSGRPLDEVEYFFVEQSRRTVSFLFDEFDDREAILEFLRERPGAEWTEIAADLPKSETGLEMCRRWVAWASSCFVECAYERTTDLSLMCSPHQLLSELAETEIRYNELRMTADEAAPTTMPRLHKRPQDLIIQR